MNHFLPRTIQIRYNITTTRRVFVTTTYLRIYTSSTSGRLREMVEHRRVSVPVLRVVCYLLPAQRTGRLPVEPHANTKITEDMTALEGNRTRERLVTNGTLFAHCVQLLPSRSGAKVLEKRRRKVERCCFRGQIFSSLPSLPSSA